MIKRVLVFVPHPDDEINIAGGLFEHFYNQKIYTTVVFCTNGDYNPRLTSQRYREATKAQKILKYQELVYLGYPDGGVGDHIYDARFDEPILSHAGMKRTYSPSEIPEYCYKRTQTHKPYTRDSLKEDISSLILEKRAELIICVDLDKHLDHKCVSLLFDECMGEILKADSDYRPFVLKGFAYNGVWCGPDDFFDVYIKSTKIDLKPFEDINEKCFPYDWNERIQIKNAITTTTFNLFRNNIFRALFAHKSQSDFYSLGFCALACFPRIANPDSCYWYKSSNNLALYSNVTVSSGDYRYINDFMLVVPSNSISDNLLLNSKGWSPDKNDTLPYVMFNLPTASNISTINIYQGYSCSIRHLRIKTDTGYDKDFLCSFGNVIKIEPNLSQVSHIEIHFLSCHNPIVVNEIELLGNNCDFPWKEMPFAKYEHVEVHRSRHIAAMSKLCFRLIVKVLMFLSKLRILTRN